MNIELKLNGRILTPFKKINEVGRSVHNNWAKLNPDIYSDKDARYRLSETVDKEYLLGSKPLDPRDQKDKSSIWGMPYPVFNEINEIVKEAHHVHVLPFVMGTYSLESRSMRMNDLCLSDPIEGYMLSQHGFSGLSLPLLRGIYFAGRPSWWRHESIHARHHHQMAYYLESTDKKKKYLDGWTSKKRMEEAAHTVHESGVEELVTRWQTLKEAKGFREQAMAGMALLFYLEYAPVTGLRNLFIDTKEKTLDMVQDGKLRIPAKWATLAAITALPIYAEGQTHLVRDLAKLGSNLPNLDPKTLESAVWRGHSYVVIAALSSLFSLKEKGVFAKDLENGERLPTSEYKFPYVYDPVRSISRSVRLLKYLNDVWDEIPNYRNLKDRKQIDKLKMRINDRVRAKFDDNKKYNLTMKMVDDAFYGYEIAPKSDFPLDANPKGLFLPSVYLNAKELYK